MVPLKLQPNGLITHSFNVETNVGVKIVIQFKAVGQSVDDLEVTAVSPSGVRYGAHTTRPSKDPYKGPIGIPDQYVSAGNAIKLSLGEDVLKVCNLS